MFVASLLFPQTRAVGLHFGDVEDTTFSSLAGSNEHWDNWSDVSATEGTESFMGNRRFYDGAARWFFRGTGATAFPNRIFQATQSERLGKIPAWNKDSLVADHYPETGSSFNSCTVTDVADPTSYMMFYNLGEPCQGDNYLRRTRSEKGVGCAVNDALDVSAESASCDDLSMHCNYNTADETCAPCGTKIGVKEKWKGGGPADTADYALTTAKCFLGNIAKVIEHDSKAEFPFTRSYAYPTVVGAVETGEEQIASSLEHQSFWNSWAWNGGGLISNAANPSGVNAESSWDYNDLYISTRHHLAETDAADHHTLGAWDQWWKGKNRRLFKDTAFGAGNDLGNMNTYYKQIRWCFRADGSACPWTTMGYTFWELPGNYVQTDKTQFGATNSVQGQIYSTYLTIVQATTLHIYMGRLYFDLAGPYTGFTGSGSGRLDIAKTIGTDVEAARTVQQQRLTNGMARLLPDSTQGPVYDWDWEAPNQDFAAVDKHAIKFYHPYYALKIFANVEDFNTMCGRHVGENVGKMVDMHCAETKFNAGEASPQLSDAKTTSAACFHLYDYPSWCDYLGEGTSTRFISAMEPTGLGLMWLVFAFMNVCVATIRMLWLIALPNSSNQKWTLYNFLFSFFLVWIYREGLW